MEDRIPEGVGYTYTYAPKLKHYHLVIHIDNVNALKGNATWLTLLSKLAAESFSSISEEEERLFGMLLEKAPLIGDSNHRPIEIKPLLKRQVITLKIRDRIWQKTEIDENTGHVTLIDTEGQKIEIIAIGGNALLIGVKAKGDISVKAEGGTATLVENQTSAAIKVTTQQQLAEQIFTRSDSNVSHSAGEFSSSLSQVNAVTNILNEKQTLTLTTPLTSVMVKDCLTQAGIHLVHIEQIEQLQIIRGESLEGNRKETALFYWWQVPLSVKSPVGRDQELATLQNALLTKEHTNKLQWVICTGLAGTGKTHLARTILYQNLRRYRAIFWFLAESEAALRDSHLRLAKSLKLGEESDPETQLKLLKGWIAETGDCLLVYDHAANYEAIASYLPSIGATVLVTSTHRHWIQGATRVELRVLSAEAAYDCLQQYIGKRSIDTLQDLEQLAKVFGYLPLALAQAGTFIQRNKVSIERYLALYSAYPEKLLKGGDQHTLPTGYQGKPIWEIWEDTLAHITEQFPLAQNLLHIVAWLSIEQIPAPFLLELAEQPNINPKNEVIWEVLGLLAQEYLIAQDMKQQTFQVHPLVQTIVRLRQSLASHSALLNTLIPALLKILSKENETGSKAHFQPFYMAHAQALLSKTEAWKKTLKEMNQSFGENLVVLLDQLQKHVTEKFPTSSVQPVAHILEKIETESLVSDSSSKGKTDELPFPLPQRFIRSSIPRYERSIGERNLSDSTPAIFISHTQSGQNTEAKVVRQVGKLTVVKTPEDLADEKQAYLTQLWNVPQRNPHFTGRIGLLNELHQRLMPEAEQVVKPVVITAAHGLGGVGKTQLAIEFIYQHFKQYPMVCWIPAESKAQIESAYLELAQDLGLVPEKVTPDEVIHILKNWLVNHPSSLLVLDNATNEEDIAPYLPPTGNYILITSRYTNWSEQGLEVGVFTIEEAREYIVKVIGQREADTSVLIDELAQTLGRLPLALAQAAAYIQQNDMRIEDYLTLYVQRKAYLLDKATLPTGDQHATVYLTWHITMEKIQKKSPLASEVMKFCAHLHNENIPGFLIEAFAKETESNPQQELYVEALGLLNGYSMLIINETNYVLSLHKVVQEVLQAELKESAFNYLLKNAHTLKGVYPYEKEQMKDYESKKQLKNHLELVQIHLEKKELTNNQSKNIYLPILADLSDAYRVLEDAIKEKNLLEKRVIIHKFHYGAISPEIVIMLTNLGCAYGDLGKAQKQKNFIERALNLQKDFPSNKPIMIKILANLANAYGDLGDFHQQKVLLIRALGIGENCLERNDPLIAAVLVNLGNAYGKLGDTCKQKELLERALLIDKLNYGENHINVAKTLFNLANAYSDFGDAHKQKELLLRVLPIEKNYYGSAHPEVAKTLDNLADAYRVLGDANTSRDLLEQALKINEDYYGTQHIGVAQILSNLGFAYDDLGKADKAEALLKRALRIYESHYGKDHVLIAKPLTILGTIYRDLGLPLESQKLLKQAVTICKANYGDQHPETAKTLASLSLTYLELGKITKSQSRLEDALAIYQTYYKSNHPEIAAVLANLGTVYGKLGNPKKERELLQQALSMEENYYGKEHPVVAATLTNLANTYYLENPSHSKTLLKHALSIKEVYYGKDHPSIASTLLGLGIVEGVLGNIKEHKALLKRALKISQNYYGDHANTAKILTNLSEVYRESGNIDKAQKLLEEALRISESYYKDQEHLEISNILTNLGVILCDSGNLHKSKELLEHALKIQEDYYGNNHAELLVTLFQLSRVEGDLGETEKEKNLLERALAIYENQPKEEGSEVEPICILILVNLMEAYYRLDDISKNQTLIQRLFDLLGGDAQEVKQTLKDFLTMLEKTYASTHFRIRYVKKLLEEINGECNLKPYSLKERSSHNLMDNEKVNRSTNRWYTDADINDYLSIIIRHELGGYVKESHYLLKGKEGKSQWVDETDGQTYFVLVTPAIDIASLSGFMTQWFDKTRQLPPKEEYRDDRHDVLDELLPLFQHHSGCHVKILFPYNQTQLHWLTGEVVIHKVEHHYKIIFMAHDPYGGGSLSTQNVADLKQVIKFRIKAFDPAATFEYQSPTSTYTQRQARGDSVSCGVIVAYEMIQRILGKSLNQPEPYLPGAPQLRQCIRETFERYLSEDDLTRRNFMQREEVQTSNNTSFTRQVSSYEVSVNSVVDCIVSLQHAALKERIVIALLDKPLLESEPTTYAVSVSTALLQYPTHLASQGGHLSHTDQAVLNQLTNHLCHPEGQLKVDLPFLQTLVAQLEMNISSFKRVSSKGQFGRSEENVESFLQKITSENSVKYFHYFFNPNESIDFGKLITNYLDEKDRNSMACVNLSSFTFFNQLNGKTAKAKSNSSIVCLGVEKNLSNEVSTCKNL